MSIPKRFKSIRYDIRLLKLLNVPISKYDAKKALGYPYSSIKMIIDEYSEQGIVKTVSKKTARTGLDLNYYQLTEIGRLLLRLATRLERGNSCHF